MEQIVEKDAGYWMEAFRNGDERALAHFFDLHYKSLCYFSGRLIQDLQQAEDIVSGCFIKLWKSDRQLQDPDNIKAFLYISCRNACFDYLRRLKVRSAKQEAYYLQLETTEEGVLNQIIESEVLELLAEEIEQLPEKCREVFKLLYFEQKRTDEIAEELGISVKTVRNHKARAIELLKAAVLSKNISPALYLSFLLFMDSYRS